MALYILMKHLCEDYNLPPPKKQERYRLTIDRDIAVFLIQEAGQVDFVISAALGPVSENSQAAIFQKLLEANHQEIVTQRCVLSFDPARNQVVLSRWVTEATIHYKDFLQMIKDFVEHVKRWSAEIKQDFAGGSKPAAEAEPQRGGFSIKV